MGSAEQQLQILERLGPRAPLAERKIEE